MARLAGSATCLDGTGGWRNLGYWEICDNAFGNVYVMKSSYGITM